MDTATPGDPDCCGIHWEEAGLSVGINKLFATVTTSAGKKHTLLR